MSELHQVPDVASFGTTVTVRAAGELLRGKMLVPVDAPTPEEYIEAFRVADQFRIAHAYPMRSIRQSAHRWMKRCAVSGITGARLKRMPAIRAKLKRSSIYLDKLQDVGGCRLILPTIADVRTIGDALTQHLRHQKCKENDYILAPKPDGYRSHHLVFAFQDQLCRSHYMDRRIEIQVRTQLQHSWATAVEAVGLYRGEYLKGSVGDRSWLRLFLLMSAEFCVAEGCPEPPGVPGQVERIAEIQALNKTLDADLTLATLANAVHWREISVTAREAPEYYLIRFDAKAKEVLVQPLHSASRAMALYSEAESVDRETGNDGNDVVLVEADKIDGLKAAYPNYFGDVTLFRQALEEVAKGRSLAELDIRRQEMVPAKPAERIDSGWLYKRNRLWVEPGRMKKTRKRKQK
ncbi:MAG: RelA/SpoT domain-containing protein [Desulfovibrio sp.]|uniref:RelA/SpoT domain-containing protein n=1 Tax=Desulfovibrio sp. TaxID=885 RepID=UPI00135D9867|nr:RelA/SpoT domain-containing protein [Desulfovibrio sp.]MTJ94208.1 RelA/SpoT domain-containing protein [Desulfovibrio sp.]